MDKAIDFRNPTKTEEKVHKHIGERLRHYRLSSGLSQEVIAKELKVSFQQFQKYENAKNRISPGKLFILAHVLRIPVGTFFPQVDVKDYEATPPRVLRVMKSISRVIALHPEEMAVIAKALASMCEQDEPADE